MAEWKLDVKLKTATSRNSSSSSEDEGFPEPPPENEAHISVKSSVKSATNGGVRFFQIKYI